MAHDPGVEAAGARARALSLRPPPAGECSIRDTSAMPISLGDGPPIYIGTAGWTDRTLTAQGVFYPDGVTTAESRLRYYTTRFPMVEVDATYYALQPASTVDRWLDRTPATFRFCIKAHALLTGHPSEPSRLPADIRQALPAPLVERPRLYATELPGEIVDEVRRRFTATVAALEAGRRLGAVLFQYPPWFGPTRANARTVAALSTDYDTLPVAVEFRNRAWVDDALRGPTLALLGRHGLAYVMVDAPPGMASSMPPDVAVTSPRLAMVRLHGRRIETWERPGVSVADRYRYLYDRAQLAEWVPRVRVVADADDAPTLGVYVVFNNCYGNYGTTNALEFMDLLRGSPSSPAS
jgi:uncharacterized protein YecE (DUF72 family)